MKVLIAFECSGIVREAFRAKGHDAWSCDLKPAEDGSKYHKRGDVSWNVEFLADSEYQFDLIIAHPPCTHIALCGNRHYAGTEQRRLATELIRRVWNFPVYRLCIENPMGQINTYLPEMPKPQLIHPWQFGHREMKVTGLWKRNLPDLIPTDVVGPPPPKGSEERKEWEKVFRMAPSPERATNRARTYRGIGQAMADQWTL